ncbi:putative RNA-binding protein C3H8.09c [Erysiphe neolycopersici]|uniref:Putative RNA-binding protein C3H8.09c n=1 Tax=Erysiphe neolycopersici TaxID=212602 RepID=A0A420I3U0_9PEZI|nr:putative RNA-binding protein C3H8.09c [Erysiphe neolycopersici]
MTSAEFDPSSAVAASSDLNPKTANPIENSNSSESSFSDAYNEDAELANVKDKNATQLDDDDYAMTFDSDGDENTDRQEVQVMSEAKIDSDVKSLSTIVSATNLSSSTIPPETTISKIPLNGTATHPLHLNHTFSDQTSANVVSNPNTSSTAQTPIEPLGVKSQSFDDFSAGGIDIQQLLDNITANAEKPDSPHLKNHSLPLHASLPPRPNVSQNRIYPDERTKYFAGAQGLPPASTSYRPPGSAPSLVAAGAPGTSTDPRSGLPPPPSASFRGQLSSANSINSNTHMLGNRSSIQELPNLSDQDEADYFDTKWAPEVQKMYDEFLEDERRYVTEGLWDRFPMGSRLFIGNLPSEKVTKRDLFHIFYHYGKIAQISIKQAYGFIQFLHSDHCYRALDCEQGTEVRGRKMHLEISKPQKNVRNAQHTAQSSGQRLKSPDRSSGGRNFRNNDRYDRQSQMARIDEYGRPLRVRDDYRPVRSITPSRGANRLRDSYDNRDRRRSRSPYNHRDSARYRERSPSPRLREGIDDINLIIPRRDPRDVPDVQIILMEQLDRQFVSWVENELHSRGIKTEVMFLSPRVSIDAVIRRQILEGVHAVSRLSSASQNSSKIPLQVFDRQGGVNNVRFDEYENLEPKIAGELVLRAKQSHTISQAQAPVYTQAPTHSNANFSNPTYQSPVIPATSNIASLVGSLDNATLQKLLGSLGPPQQQPNLAVTTSVAPTPPIDLAGLLGGLKNHSTNQTYALPSQNEVYNNNGHAIRPQFRGNNIQSSLSPAQSQPAQQVQNIMAQLARYRQ